MSQIVSNTSPIHYLILIGEQDLLPHLYGRIIIPSAVFMELTHQKTPEIVRKFVQTTPEWLKIQSVEQTDASLSHLDAGEREAIMLAKNIQAGLLLIDEKKGRKVADEHGLNYIGTLGILEDADTFQMVDFPVAIHKLQQTNARISPSLIQKSLHRHYSNIATS